MDRLRDALEASFRLAGEAGLPVAAKPAHSLLGPAPNCLLMCPVGTGGRSGGSEQRDAALQTGQCLEQASPVG